jgi:hypothetical protein
MHSKVPPRPHNPSGSARKRRAVSARRIDFLVFRNETTHNAQHATHASNPGPGSRAKGCVSPARPGPARPGRGLRGFDFACSVADVALQFLGNLFEYLLKKRGKKLTVRSAASLMLRALGHAASPPTLSYRMEAIYLAPPRCLHESVRRGRTGKRFGAFAPLLTRCWARRRATRAPLRYGG